MCSREMDAGPLIFRYPHAEEPRSLWHDVRFPATRSSGVTGIVSGYCNRLALMRTPPPWIDDTRRSSVVANSSVPKAEAAQTKSRSNSGIKQTCRPTS